MVDDLLRLSILCLFCDGLDRIAYRIALTAARHDEPDGNNGDDDGTDSYQIHGVSLGGAVGERKWSPCVQKVSPHPVVSCEVRDVGVQGGAEHPQFEENPCRMAIFAKDTADGTPRAGGGKSQEPEGSSFLGPKAIVEGTISGTENVLVEGTVKGTVNLEADLRIGVRGRVEAKVHARTVFIEGTLIGDVSADRKVELVSTARVDGNIKAPKIVVAEGARFRGAVDMGSEPPVI